MCPVVPCPLSVGIVSFMTTPLDLIKTKLMMQSTSGGGQYSGVIDALSSIYNEGGRYTYCNIHTHTYVHTYVHTYKHTHTNILSSIYNEGGR